MTRNERRWTLSRIVGRDGRPRGDWQIGLPDERPEHSEIEVVHVAPVEDCAGASSDVAERSPSAESSSPSSSAVQSPKEDG